MQSKDMEEPNVRAAIRRARTENIKEKARAIGARESKPVASPAQIEHRLETLTKQTGSREEAVRRLERVLKGDDLTDIKYLLQGVLCARSICRIVVRREGASPTYGTGFLIAPGVIMTNHHVLRTVEDVKASCVEFNYELDLRGRHMTPTTFTLRTEPEPILSEELDMAIAAVEPFSDNGKPVEHFGWLQLIPHPGKAFIGEYLTIIQHPRGEPKQVCVRENKVLKYSGTGPYVWYQSDTDAGSSGAPVFNNAWEVVALHHCSIPYTNDQGQMLTWDGQLVDGNTESEEIAWLANEGVRVSHIIGYLQDLGRHPLVERVLAAPEPPLVELPLGMGVTETEPRRAADTGVRTGDIQVRSDGDGVTRILVPIEISVKVNVGGHETTSTVSVSQPPAVTSSDAPKPPPEADPTPSPAGELEKVVVNQMDYGKRNGYDPHFLGHGLDVPLPIVTPGTVKKLGKVARLPDGTHELKYWNYSVVMNKKRKLAYFSAANVDSSRFMGNRDASGDTWYEDTRISPVEQLGAKDRFYGEPFDKGHLTSRSDLQWWRVDGDSGDGSRLTAEQRAAIAKRNGDDSYHWTNCAPQHGAFNRASARNGLWRRLELAAISELSARNVNRFCIINGPVFDAPRSTMQNNKLTALNLGGARVADGTSRGVQIPRLFFKIIAYSVRSRVDPSRMELRAKAFVVSQENLLNRDEIADFTEKDEKFTSEEIDVYQVTVSALQKLTGLDFGKLCDSDWIGRAEESLGSDEPVKITDESALVF